jgi:hypothetical protein
MNKSLVVDINGSVETEEKHLTIKSADKESIIISVVADKAFIKIKDLEEALKAIKKFLKSNKL